MYSSGSTAWVVIDLFHHCCPLAELPLKDVGLWSWLPDRWRTSWRCKSQDASCIESQVLNICLGARERSLLSRSQLNHISFLYSSFFPSNTYSDKLRWKKRTTKQQQQKTALRPKPHQCFWLEQQIHVGKWTVRLGACQDLDALIIN